MQVIYTIKKHKKVLIILLCLLVVMLVALIAACYYTINPYRRFIVSTQDAKHMKVGIVLGGGISKDGKPFNELKARLDSAADALNSGIVEELILSGDNRFKNYDEPTAMKSYLTESRDIASDKLTADYAGRSTYESCERAAKVFGAKEIIIFSAGSHLPRAIYLCRHFNIEAYGIANGTEANNSGRREPLARVKAIYNTLLVGENTILGDPIPLN